jgi:neutral ceramidase
MGFGQMFQRTSGIHTRLFSRAFIFEEATPSPTNGNTGPPPSRVVYVCVDTCMIGQLVKKRVIQALSRVYGKDMYR